MRRQCIADVRQLRHEDADAVEQLPIASVTTIAAADDHTSRPQLIDQYGNGQYFVLLDEQFAELEDGTAEAPARLTMDPYNARDFYGWHRPNVRALVKRLERTYGIQAILMTSYALPAFAAYIPKATVERLRSDRAIDVIVPVTEPTTVFTAWTDTTSGAEIIPWGKTAIGANDALSTSNRVSVVSVVSG